MSATARRLACLCAATALGLTPAAAAGTAAPEAVPLPPVPPSSLDLALPPYQARLDRLAELLGTLTYLRDLCGERDGASWRGRMETLLEAEGTTPERRERLAGSFNRGFSGYQLIYRACTPAAEAVIVRALGEGSALTGGLSSDEQSPSP